MPLEALHHVTMITADAQRTVDFYADVLGLRLVKTTVNFDRPAEYHLYVGDEQGRPGSLLTWFVQPDARPGRAGAGMVHRLQLAVADVPALEFWAARLQGRGIRLTGGRNGVLFQDPDGLGIELTVHDVGAQLKASHPDVPAAHAISGVMGARAYSASPEASARVLSDLLGFRREPTDDGDEWTVFGEARHVHWTLDPAPAAPGVPGAGTVHHIAWGAKDGEHEAWRTRLADAGASITPVIDRDYFRAVYFREPGGVVFEIATLGPGFAVDEDAGHLGEQLRLPAQHEALRERLAGELPAIVHPRTGEPIGFDAP